MFQSDDAAPLERLITTILDPGLGYKFAAIDSIDLTFEEGFFVTCISLYKNFMSSAILVSISDLRKQYLDILIDIGFVNDANMSSVNVHSKVARVIKAAVVSGLYPQIATVQLPDIRFVCVFFLKISFR